MEIIHDKNNHRFYCIVEGKECFAEYEIEEDGSWNFYHTFTPLSLRGRGIAKSIFDEILKYVKENRLKVIPSCSYAEKYFEENGREFVK